MAQHSCATAPGAVDLAKEHSEFLVVGAKMPSRVAWPDRVDANMGQAAATNERPQQAALVPKSRASQLRTIKRRTVGSIITGKMLKQDSARLFVFDLAHNRASASRLSAFPRTLRYESKLPKWDDRGTVLMILFRFYFFFDKC